MAKRSGTHGKGSKKKGRGAGGRGGKGRAGSRKHRKLQSSTTSQKGFKSPRSLANRIINVGELEKYATRGRVDLHTLGFDKLLGAGEIKRPLKVKVACASKKAISKVKKAGGEVA